MGYLRRNVVNFSILVIFFHLCFTYEVNYAYGMARKQPYWAAKTGYLCHLVVADPRSEAFNVAHGQSCGEALQNCHCREVENISIFSELSFKNGHFYERTVCHITCVVGSL